jgi:hypothetical protein
MHCLLSPASASSANTRGSTDATASHSSCLLKVEYCTGIIHVVLDFDPVAVAPAAKFADTYVRRTG